MLKIINYDKNYVTFIKKKFIMLNVSFLKNSLRLF